MDKLVETRRERFWFPIALQRDQFVKAEAAKLPPGSRVLDAGAGASKYRPLFAHCRYETQDFCQFEGQLVKYLQPIDYVCDILRIPLPDQSLDAVLCTEVLEHVPQPTDVLAEFARLLKPDGKLLLTTPVNSWLHMEPYHYYGGYTPYWFEHWLPKQGFRLESIAPQGGPGRVAVLALENFYNQLRTRERHISSVARLASWLVRLGLKLPVHYLLPWLANRLDSQLDGFRTANGYMVVATRVVSNDPAALKSQVNWNATE